MISASQLYDFVQCPHRVVLDTTGEPAERDDPNAFVELLWKQGVNHEAKIVTALHVPMDVRSLPVEDRERETRVAMQRGETLIYGGRLTSRDMVGEPDLLERRGVGYIPGDIKSGSGFEGDESDGKLKKPYAFQLAHYVLILEQLGLGDGSREAFVIDRAGKRVPYSLLEPQGVRNTQSWWDGYLEALAEVRALVAQQQTSRGALASVCKLCHWYSHCRRDLIAQDDLTLIAELGRSKRDVMLSSIPNVRALADRDPAGHFRGTKTEFAGIGQETLLKFHERAKLRVAFELPVRWRAHAARHAQAGGRRGRS